MRTSGEEGLVEEQRYRRLEQKPAGIDRPGQPAAKHSRASRASIAPSRKKENKWTSGHENDKVGLNVFGPWATPFAPTNHLEDTSSKQSSVCVSNSESPCKARMGRRISFVGN